MYVAVIQISSIIVIHTSYTIKENTLTVTLLNTYPLRKHLDDI